jgi:YHS domain-containing protein
MAKTMVAIDDTKMSSGGMKMEVEGEEVVLENDGNSGFKCNVNGKEYKFSNEEIAAMLHEQLRK